VAPWAALVVAVGTMVGFAVVSNGYPINEVKLHDSGIWVTSNADDVYGRMNMTAASLDATLSPGVNKSGNLDIFQDDASVVADDVANGVLIPVDPVAVANNVKGEVPAGANSLVAMGSGSIAVLDQKSGDVWAVRYTPGDVPDLLGLDQTGKPLAQLGAPPTGVGLASAGALAIDANGTVYAVSASGAEATLSPDQGNGFTDPVMSQLGASLGGVAATAVGDQLIVMDTSTGDLYLPGGKKSLIPAGQDAVLQQPGPAASAVYVATKTDLFAAPLGGDAPVSLVSGAAGAPARPVVVAGDVDAAWAGDPGRLEQGPADGVTPTTSVGLDRDKTLLQPTFRVNHGRALLNDMATGRVFDMVSATSLDDWQSVQPPSVQDSNQQDTTSHQVEAPPKAADDNLGARPGRTTVLHVLDNDSDPAGNVLAITAVDAPQGGATATISADGQTVLFTAPDGLTGSQTFGYTISNGQATASANITVTMRSDAENSPPALRDGFTPTTFPAASGATVGLFVAQDWRDPDGDPISVVSATAAGQSLPVSPQGKIFYTAPRMDQATDVEVDYTVSDGHADAQVSGKVTVHVLGANDTAAVAPKAQADLVRGVVGVPVTFSPLANDLPGADPRDPAAQLALAGNVAQVAGLTSVTTDLVANTVTVVAATAGTYNLTYTAAFGSTAVSPGQIRLEIADQGSSDPVAVPDQVTVRGQVAVTVDVIANDIDPSNSVLTVTQATAADPSQLAVAVFDGRWVRIQALDNLSPNPQVVHYMVTNGLSAPVQGDVTVTQVAAPAVDSLILADDTATVRAGDTALIDVLANDSSTSGKTLVLEQQPDPTLPSGQLPAVVVGSSATGAAPDAGQAYVVGNEVRYVAPANVTDPIQVAVTYAAATSDGGTPQSATLTIDVKPPPSDTNPDTAPVPLPVEARAVSGDTKVIPIPIYGIDPDGDSVTVTGIASAPTLGRVTAVSPTSITYQAFPTDGNDGTDSFTYTVADKYGLTGTGTVRVGLAPPGIFPPPVAIDDTVTAQPGAPVTVQPMTNDLIAVGDNPVVVPVGTLPAGVTLSSDQTTFSLTAPADQTDAPIQFSYLLRGAGGDGPAATVTVKAKDSFLNPPNVYDTVATIGSDGTASASPLATAWDVDGPASAIQLTGVGAGTINADGTVTGIPVTDQIQALSYTVKDGDGATSSAIIFVPQSGAGAPQLIANVKPVQMDQNSTTTINLSDYVFSPQGKDIRIGVTDSITAAPASGLTAQAASTTSLTLTSQNDYVGPAAVSLQVADGASTDPATLTAFLTIPVQIGPPTPVLRCPTTPQSVIQGGADLVLDITALCHVWTPDAATAAALSYTAAFATPLADVTATGGPTVAVTAAGAAVPDSSAQLTVGIANSPAVTQQLTITVVAAPKPTITVADLTDIKQGTTATQTVAMTSPLKDAQPTIVSVTQTSGPPATIGQPTGMSFTLTPGADTHGTMTFAVVAQDLSDLTRVERQVNTSFTMTVYGRPDAPNPPQPGTQLLTHAVALTYTPNADNGAAIDQYEVKASDGRFDQSCGLLTNCTIKNVPNGQPIAFQVRAHNKADWSDWSPVGPSFTPNEVPGMATAFTAGNPADGALTLTWGAAPVDGTPVTAYHLTWTGGTTGSQDLSGTATSATVTGLVNDQMNTFNLVAENAAGMSTVTASTKGQSSGKPLGCTAPTITAADQGATAMVTMTWPAVDPNGPSPATYQITRTGGSAGTITFAPTTATSLSDTNAITYDGTTYTYTLTATNATGGSDHTCDPASANWQATGTPADWDNSSISSSPTGTSGQVNLTFNYPAARGARSSVTVTWPGGTYNVPSPSTAGGTATTTISGLTDGQPVTFNLKACNEGNCTTTSWTTPADQTPFGPLAPPTITTRQHGGQGDRVVCATASGDGNGRDATLMLSVPINATTTYGQSTTQSGSMNIPEICQDAGGPNVTVTFTATLTSSATNPPRTDPAAVSQGITSPADPPLAAPVFQGSLDVVGAAHSGDRNVCASADGNGNGMAAHMVINASGGATGNKTSDSTAGDTGNVQLCVKTTSASSTVHFTAQMINDDSTSDRGDSPTATRDVTSASDPLPVAPPTTTAPPAARAWVTFGSGSCVGAGAPSCVILNTSNFPAGKYSVSVMTNNTSNGTYQSYFNCSATIPANGSINPCETSFNYPGKSVYVAISGWGNSEAGKK